MAIKQDRRRRKTERTDEKSCWEPEPRDNVEKSPSVGSLGSSDISSSAPTVVFWFLLCSHLLVYLSALELSVTQKRLCGIWGKEGPGMGQPGAEQGRERKVATE